MPCSFIIYYVLTFNKTKVKIISFPLICLFTHNTPFLVRDVVIWVLIFSSIFCINFILLYKELAQTQRLKKKNPTPLLCHHFYGSKFCAWPNWLLSSGSHKFTMKVTAGLHFHVKIQLKNNSTHSRGFQNFFFLEFVGLRAPIFY